MKSSPIKNSKILCWNVCSLVNQHKLLNTLQLFDDLNIDIACLTETWWTSSSGTFSKCIRDAGFKLSHAHRSNTPGGGVAIIYKATLKLKNMEKSTVRFSSFEYCSVLLHSTLKIIILCIYRKQEIPMNAFISEFTDIMDEMTSKCESILVLGDFNIWIDEINNKDSISINNIMNSYGLSQLVSEPTHIKGHTLDHLYANQYQVKMSSCVLHVQFDISPDHFPIMAELHCIKQESVPKKVKYRQLASIDLDIFKKSIQDVINTLHIDEDSSFGENYAKFKINTKMLLDRHAPERVKTIKSNSSTPKWMDTEFRRQRSIRRKYERIWRRKKDGVSRSKYIEQRNLCAALSTNKQEIYYRRLISEAAGSQKELYKIVNKVLDRTKSRVIPLYSNAEELANNMNSFFINKIKTKRNKIPHTEEIFIANRFSGVSLTHLGPVETAELKEIVVESGIKTSESDPLPSKILASVIDILLPFYAELINKSFSSCSLDGVKQSIINPLYKEGNLDTELFTSYRPINNIEFFRKLIERVVSRRIHHHMLILP